MSSFLLTVLSATVALSTAQPSTEQPTDCQPAVIGLSTALGISLTATAAAVLYVFKDRLCCSQHVYDTPCPYCDIKQPKACMREHIADCLEHKKYWTPRLQSQRITVMPLRSSLKPASRDLPPTPSPV